MDLRKLKYFVILSEEMNFRKAAERLFITQPTLSQQIKQLEIEVGLNLFNREKNQITLTAEGKMLVASAYHIIKETESLQIKLNDYHHLLQDEIKIGVTGTNLVLNPIENFAKQYPKTKISLLEKSFRSLCQKINEEEISFGICYHYEMKDFELARKIIGQDIFHCILPINHPLAYNNSLSITDLTDYPLILAQESLTIRKSLQHYENQTNTKLMPQYEMPNYTSCLTLVEKGLGVSILPLSFLTSHPLSNFVHLPLADFTESRNISVIYRRDHAFTPSEEQFLDCVMQCF